MNGNSFLTSTFTRSRTSPSTASWRWTHCGAHLSMDYVSTLLNFRYFVLLLILTRQPLSLLPSPFYLIMPPDCITSRVSKLVPLPVLIRQPACPCACQPIFPFFLPHHSVDIRNFSDVQVYATLHCSTPFTNHQSYFFLLINLCHPVAIYHTCYPFTAPSPLTMPLPLNIPWSCTMHVALVPLRRLQPFRRALTIPMR
jgi:hypothetical protein